MSALPAPPLKRSHSNLSQSAQSLDEEDDDDKYVPLLEGQNKSLNREVKKFKRKLLEKSKDLENLHNKSLELEQLVAIIQQCWGQVNQTATQLIGSLQEPNGETTTNIEINQLLSSYLQAGSKYLTHNPVGTDYKDSALNLDQWSNPNEIEKEQSRLQELINSRTDDVVYGTDLNEIASRHVETTGQLLGQLCNGVVHCGKLNVQQAELLFRPNINIREVQSEREILVTRVVKLNQAIIDLKFQLHTANVDRERLHRKVLLAGEIQGVVLAPLVRSASDGSSVVGGITTPAAAVIPPSSSAEAVVVEDEEKMQVDGNSSSLALRVNESVPTQDGSIDSSMAASLIGKTCSVPTTHAGHNEQEEVLRQQLELLEKQLTDCEAERLRLDTAITDHIATVPVTVSSETAELQKALDLLRTHTQQRVDTAHKECIDLHDKISGLEAAMQIVETSAGEQYERLAADAESARRVLESERAALQTELAVARAELQAVPQIKTQVMELEALESTARVQLGKLREKVRKLTSTLEKTTESLAQSRAREIELTQSLTAASSSAGGDADKNQLAIQILENQIRDLNTELVETRAGMLDLTLEIESVSEEEVRAREQAAKLLSQVGDAEAMRSGLLEENLKLHGQIEELKRNTQDMQRKVDSAEGLKKLQDSLMSQLRAAEKQLRTELSTTSRNNSHDAQRVYDLERLVESLQSKLRGAESTLADEKLRIVALQVRCNESSSALSNERKAKMELQRDMKKKAKTGGEGADKKSSTPESFDSAKLQMTLDMLRCSVCQDRFKSVAITRCFHLFCKECIDENLRNRHRKCPACGDKFGQDDVRPVFFGN